MIFDNQRAFIALTALITRVLNVDRQFLKVLLIEDHVAQAELILDTLAGVAETRYEVTVVRRVSEAMKCLRDRTFDLILLDLSLPDSYGIETLLQVQAEASQSPIIVLTVLDDRNLAIESVRQGAEDYLVKGRIDSEWLGRAINYAIERQRIKAELQQKIERERLMGRMTERIRQSLKLETILKTTVDEVRQFLKTDRVLIYRCQERWQGEIVEESLRAESENLPPPLNFNATLTMLQQVSRNPEAFPIQEYSPIPSQEPDELEGVLKSLVNAVLTVPIWQSRHADENYLWGQLIAHDYSSSRQWQDWEMEFLSLLANQVAIAIRQSELYQEVERLATLDGLTEVANRRQFDQILSKEWQRLTREQHPLSLILCDVDFFKQYNDAYGHLCGDDCLKQVAQAIRENIQRPADLVARYGGEEFGVILPNTDRQGALTVAQNIRSQLDALQIPHQASAVSPYVTISIGIGTLIPQVQQAPLLLVEIADRALLQAKVQGRDRIVYGYG